jgi:hypothetical protein
MDRELEAESARQGADSESAAEEDIAGEEEAAGDLAARFERVATAMNRILAPSPTLALDPATTAGERRALGELFAAATGSDRGRHLSAYTRLKWLNRALARLRPTLATGRAADVANGPERTGELARKVQALRDAIGARIAVEAVAFHPAGGPGAEDDSENENEGEEGDGGRDEAPAGTERDPDGGATGDRG